LRARGGDLFAIVWDHKPSILRLQWLGPFAKGRTLADMKRKLGGPPAAPRCRAMARFSHRSRRRGCWYAAARQVSANSDGPIFSPRRSHMPAMDYRSAQFISACGQPIWTSLPDPPMSRNSSENAQKTSSSTAPQRRKDRGQEIRIWHANLPGLAAGGRDALL